MTHSADIPINCNYDDGGLFVCCNFTFLYVFMFLEQDPFRQLKDLSLLKGQLEDIQRRMEDEVGVGIPQAGVYIFLSNTFFCHIILYIS